MTEATVNLEDELTILETVASCPLDCNIHGRTALALGRIRAALLRADEDVYLDAMRRQLADTLRQRDEYQEAQRVALARLGAIEKAVNAVLAMEGTWYAFRQYPEPPDARGHRQMLAQSVVRHVLRSALRPEEGEPK